MKFTKISFFLLLISFSQMTHALNVPDGSNGYIGEFYPTQSYLNVRVSNANRAQGTIGINNTKSYCNKSNNGVGDFLFPLPGGQDGEYGLKLYNKNASPEENKTNYLVAAINGKIVIQHSPSNQGMRLSAFIDLNRGKASDIRGENSNTIITNGPLCWYGFYTRFESSQLNINSYSIYAVGNVKPGIYDFVRPLYWSAAQPKTGGGGYIVDTVPFSFDDGPIHVLKKCNVTPMSSTNIQFAPQLAKQYSSPKLLDKYLAGIMVSCPNNGSLYVSLKPFGELVDSSKTGMKMKPDNPLNANEAAPYISVSDGEKSVTDAICNKNDSNAFEFYNGKQLGSYKDSSLMKSLSFNLCAQGNVPANNYKGSIDVSILVE